MENASLVLNITASESRWRSRLSDGAFLFSGVSRRVLSK